MQYVVHLCSCAALNLPSKPPHLLHPQIKMDKTTDGFPLTSVREIDILMSLHHPNIVNTLEVVVGKHMDSVFMVMEYAEHDIKKLLEYMVRAVPGLVLRGLFPIAVACTWPVSNRCGLF